MPLFLSKTAWAGCKPAYRAWLVATAIGAAGLFLPSQGAMAQAVIATVNSSPVTTFDVEQRIRIAAMIERRRLDRKTAVQELIDDQVKLIEARRIGYRVTEEGVEAEFSKFAKNARVSEREFEGMLIKSGIQPSAVRAKIRADLAWVVLLRDQTRRGTGITGAELEAELEARRKKETTITDYSLRQVVFIVPRGVSPSTRMASANAARSRFNSCETGFDELRNLPDVAIRVPVMRSSADLSPQLRQLFEKTPVNSMTPPAPSPDGIELVAVCGKKVRDNTTTERANVAVDLSEKKITENAKAYLASLRKKVDIRNR